MVIVTIEQPVPPPQSLHHDPMINRFRLARAEFPPQYWLLFFGLMISFTGACLVWPYLLIHISRTLDLPLSSITRLLALNYGVGLISSFIAGRAWTIGNGTGSLIGSFLNDNFDPAAVWYGEFGMRASGAIGCLIMEMRKRRNIQIGERSLA